MAKSGVEAVRITLGWDQIEPSQGNYDFPTLDRLVKSAALHGLQVLFNVTETPRWASSRPNGDFWKAPPANPAVFGRHDACVRPALRPQRQLLGGEPDHPAGADPPLADLERGERALALGREALGAGLRHSCSSPPTRPSRAWTAAPP